MTMPQNIILFRNKSDSKSLNMLIEQLQSLQPRKYNFFLVSGKGESKIERGLYKEIIFVKDYQSEFYKTLDFILSAFKNINAHAIVSFADISLMMASLVALKLNLPFISVQTALRCKNKYLMRLAFEKGGVNQRGFFLVKTVEDIERFKTKKFPVIAKPISASTSNFVKLLNNFDELRDYYNQFQESKIFSLPDNLQNRYLLPEFKNTNWSKSFLVEEVLPGKEVSVEGVIIHGKIYFAGITDKEVSQPPYFIEVGHIFPSQKPHKLQNKIYAFCETAIGSLGIDNSAFHAEIKIDEQENLYIVEVGARLGGGLIQNLIFYTLGYNMYDSAIQVASQDFSDFQVTNPSRKKIATTQYLIAPQEGIFAGVEDNGFNYDFRENIKEIDIFPTRINKKILLPPQNYELLRLGRYVLVGDSYAQLKKVIQEFKKRVKPIIK